MSRDDGFAIADLDTGLLADPKVVALARRLREPVQTAAHVALYTSLVLESWGAGERLTFEDTVPAWWLEPVEDARTNLAAVGLIDQDGRIPERAWESWFRPAWNRREERREAGALGGHRKAQNARDAMAELQQSQGDAIAELYPSVPSVPFRPITPVPAGPSGPDRPFSAPAGANGRSAGPSPAGDPGVDRV